jgi:hypothetical protein
MRHGKGLAFDLGFISLRGSILSRDDRRSPWGEALATTGIAAFRGRSTDENTATVVAPQMVPACTIGHVEVEIAVAIEVEPGRACSYPDVSVGPARVSDVAQGGQGRVSKKDLGLAGVSGEAAPCQQEDTDISNGAHKYSLYCFELVALVRLYVGRPGMIWGAP